MQISRLFEIVFVLLQKESVTAAELAERFEVSTRTIYRDIDVLSGAGIPVYAAKGRYGGIRLLPEFVLSRSWFSAEEQDNILAGVQSLSASGLPEAELVLRKLVALFQQGGDAPWVAVDFSDWGGDGGQKLALVKAGILQRRVLDFVYYNANNERLHRRAEPIQLWFKHRAWYLKAFCLEKEQPRLFKLSRIREPVLTDLPCTHAPLGDVPLPPPPSDAWVEVELLIAQSAAYRVFDEFDEEQITPLSEGGFRVRMRAIEDDWIVGYLLSFGADCTVLSPERIRLRLAHSIDAMREKYREL